MKCDKLKPVFVDMRGNIVANELGELYYKPEVDAAIDELKTEHHKERDEYISMVHSREQTIKELKQKLENVQASMYCDVVDANMENRRLKRALYKACANWAMNARMVEIEAEPWGENHESRLWAGVYDKCQKKAEEYK